MSLSRLEQIELAFANRLNTIVQGAVHGDYTYFTGTGQVQVYDNALAVETNDVEKGDDKLINHTVYEDLSSGITASEISFSQNGQESQCIYVVESDIQNLVGDEGCSENEARAIGSKIFDDLLFCFFEDYTLEYKVEFIKNISMNRAFTTRDDRIHAGMIVTRWLVQFTQNLKNPSTPACGY